MTLEGRVVIVTGATRGIGRAVADAVAARGGSLVLTARDAEALTTVGHEMVERGQQVVTVAGDVTVPGLGERLIEAALSSFGKLDGLVNNAGKHVLAPIWEQTDEMFDEVVATDLTGPFLLSQAVIRHWNATGNAGTIVNITSVEASVVFPDQATYVAAKGGLRGLSATLAAETAAQGIRVNCVAPGVIDTPMTPERERTSSSRGQIPMQRLGTAGEVAAAVVFLLGDEASYVTGTSLVVDGGYVLR